MWADVQNKLGILHTGIGLLNKPTCEDTWTNGKVRTNGRETNKITTVKVSWNRGTPQFSPIWIGFSIITIHLGVDPFMEGSSIVQDIFTPCPKASKPSCHQEDQTFRSPKAGASQRLTQAAQSAESIPNFAVPAASEICAAGGGYLWLKSFPQYLDLLNGVPQKFRKKSR